MRKQPVSFRLSQVLMAVFDVMLCGCREKTGANWIISLSVSLSTIHSAHALDMWTLMEPPLPVLGLLHITHRPNKELALHPARVSVLVFTLQEPNQHLDSADKNICNELVSEAV